MEYLKKKQQNKTEQCCVTKVKRRKSISEKKSETTVFNIAEKWSEMNSEKNFATWESWVTWTRVVWVKGWRHKIRMGWNFSRFAIRGKRQREGMGVDLTREQNFLFIF